MSVLKVEPLEYLDLALSPEAAGKIVSKQLDPHDLGGVVITFSKWAQWPVKPWYQAMAGKLVNRLVAAGKVEAIVGWGAFKGVNGTFITDLSGTRDTGPDEYGLVFVVFVSKSTPAELDEFIGVKCFSGEGEISESMPMWDGIGEDKSKRLTLIEQMLQDLEGKSGVKE